MSTPTPEPLGANAGRIPLDPPAEPLPPLVDGADPVADVLPPVWRSRIYVGAIALGVLNGGLWTLLGLLGALDPATAAAAGGIVSSVLLGIGNIVAVGYRPTRPEARGYLVGESRHTITANGAPVAEAVVPLIAAPGEVRVEPPREK